ncbi:MAG: hypothetical protein JRJ56_00235 [Deltaproteobacteria bacterium]|nr:hypothetical protein [Deltaproteobacteria bacterium]
MRKCILFGRCFLILVFSLALAAGGYAQETKVTIRLKSHDAKFIATSIGGARIVVKDAISGKILDEGFLEGGTGNTKVQMIEPIKRGTRLANEGTAKFVARLEIDRPTKVRIEATGPFSAGNNIQQYVKTMWVLPGHDIDGDGIIFEVYGLIVYPTAPAPHQFFKLGQPVKITARVDMMCGCPIKPGGLWNADDVQVVATIYNGKGRRLAAVPLKWTGTSTFTGSFTPPKPGVHKIVVTAANDQDHNYGVGYTSFHVLKK